MNNIKKSLGKRVKLFRELKNLTQEELAEQIGVNSRTVSLIERGLNFVTADTLNSLALALDVSPKKLFDFDDEYNFSTNIKDRLLELINDNNDKVYTIYKIVKGYLE
ncbi:helix-turn-helix transcriptional regulator [bacterium]|nr:helix-turn-helix transcriptional regulator [bacterium]